MNKGLILFSFFVVAAQAAPPATPDLTSDWPTFESDPPDAQVSAGSKTPERAVAADAPTKAPKTKDGETKAKKPDPKPTESAQPQNSQPPNSQIDLVDEWTKKIGEHITLRATSEHLYIKAGETMVVLDQSGKVVIQAAESLNIETKKDLLFKSGGDIRLEAGGRVVTSGGGSP